MIAFAVLAAVLAVVAYRVLTRRHDRRHGWLPKAPRDELLRFGPPISHVHITDKEEDTP